MAPRDPAVDTWLAAYDNPQRGSAELQAVVRAWCDARDEVA